MLRNNSNSNVPDVVMRADDGTGASYDILSAANRLHLDAEQLMELKRTAYGLLKEILAAECQSQQPVEVQAAVDSGTLDGYEQAAALCTAENQSFCKALYQMQQTFQAILDLGKPPEQATVETYDEFIASEAMEDVFEALDERSNTTENVDQLKLLMQQMQEVQERQEASLENLQGLDQDTPEIAAEQLTAVGMRQTQADNLVPESVQVNSDRFEIPAIRPDTQSTLSVQSAQPPVHAFEAPAPRDIRLDQAPSRQTWSQQPAVQQQPDRAFDLARVPDPQPQTQPSQNIVREQPTISNNQGPEPQQAPEPAKDIEQKSSPEKDAAEPKSKETEQGLPEAQVVEAAVEKTVEVVEQQTAEEELAANSHESAGLEVQEPVTQAAQVIDIAEVLAVSRSKELAVERASADIAEVVEVKEQVHAVEGQAGPVLQVPEQENTSPEPAAQETAPSIEAAPPQQQAAVVDIAAPEEGIKPAVLSRDVEAPEIAPVPAQSALHVVEVATLEAPQPSNYTAAPNTSTPEMLQNEPVADQRSPAEPQSDKAPELPQIIYIDELQPLPENLGGAPRGGEMDFRTDPIKGEVTPLLRPHTCDPDCGCSGIGAPTDQRDKEPCDHVGPCLHNADGAAKLETAATNEALRHKGKALVLDIPIMAAGLSQNVKVA